jgi:hypothetical protein
MITHILFLIVGGFIGCCLSSLFLRILKSKRWLRISLTTKFYEDCYAKKETEPVKRAA